MRWSALALLAMLACAAPAAAQTRADRDACGEAAFATADVAGRAFVGYRITLPTIGGPADVIRALTSEIASASMRAQSVAQGYEPVMSCGSPVWTIAALVRQGDTYETLARVIETARRAATSSGARGAPNAPTPQTSTGPELRSIHCLALVRFVLAARGARAGGITSEAAIAASLRLESYDVALATQCVAEQHSRDPSFTPLVPGEVGPPRR